MVGAVPPAAGAVGAVAVPAAASEHCVEAANMIWVLWVVGSTSQNVLNGFKSVRIASF